MNKLIKLELVKNKISPYLAASLSIFLFCEAFCFLPSLVQAVEGDAFTITEVELFQQWNNLTALISVLSVVFFSILSAVMHARFTLEEYVGKRAILLFSYPQSRSRILFAKCSLVFFFTAIVLVICNVSAILIFGVVSNFSGLMPEPFLPAMIPDLLAISGVCGLMAGAVGLIAMRVGFWKKSMIAAIVTSFLLVAPFGNTISYFTQYSNLILIAGMGVLLLIGLAVFLGLLKKVNKMEIVS